MEKLEGTREGNDSNIEKFRGLDDVVIFTTTLYKDDELSRVRQELGLKLLANASELGVRTVVVDGGSNQEFLEKARALDGVTILNETPGKTMGAGRRQALNEALKFEDASVFFWVEPEKDTLINAQSLGDMVEKIKTGAADIVVPRRKEMDSLPKFQKWIEKRANKRISPKQELDLWFGPRMFNRDAAGYFSKYKGIVDKWDAIVMPVIEAYRDRDKDTKIVSVDVDYVYDPSQVEAEENDRVMRGKRLDQYRQILAATGDDFWSREGKGLENGQPKITKLKDSPEK